MAWTTYTYNSLNGYCGNCSIVLSSKISIMIENKKVITRSLIVLFLILAIVYSLTYQKKESLFKASARTWNEVENQTWIQNQNLEQNWWFITQNSINLVKDAKIEDIKTAESVSLWYIQPSWVTNSNTQISNTERTPWVSLNSANVSMLPGTTEYLGTLDIVGILWKKPEFTLQDSQWNYFAYYGSHLDFKETVQTLGGDVYEMVTESEILQNQLFGDRVSYINLSMFKDVWVLMVIEIDSDVWLLQIPADKYHYSKDYIRSLFIH